MTDIIKQNIDYLSDKTLDEAESYILKDIKAKFHKDGGLGEGDFFALHLLVDEFTVEKHKDPLYNASELPKTVDLDPDEYSEEQYSEIYWYEKGME